MFVLILGMHRSGTSCLAGCLEHAGLYLGNVNRCAAFNVKGNFELKEVWHLHNQILKANGGSWHQPPAEVRADEEQKEALRGIADRLSKHAPCALKDPRLLLLLDMWMEIVESPVLIGAYRHPVAVARSLSRRDQMAESDAFNLWLFYNAELVQRHKAAPFPIVKFALSSVETYCRIITTLAVTLGLSPDMAKLREFVSTELDHHLCPEDPVPEICADTYAYLERNAYRPPMPDDEISIP